MANSQSVTCGAHRVAVCPPGEKAETSAAALAVNSRAQLPCLSTFSCHSSNSFTGLSFYPTDRNNLKDIKNNKSRKITRKG